MGEGSGHVESIDSTDWQPSSFPAVRVDQRVASNQLLIRIITLKRSTGPRSRLFEILEKESLEVLQYDIPSTKEKDLYNIQVKVVKPSELDMKDLKSKLLSWGSANSAK